MTKDDKMKAVRSPGEMSADLFADLLSSAEEIVEIEGRVMTEDEKMEMLKQSFARAAAESDDDLIDGKTFLKQLDLIDRPCPALCENCKQQVEATYQLRDLPIRDNDAVAEGVLCIVCNTCGTVCGFHDSSLEVVQAAVRRARGLNPYSESDLLKGLTPEKAHADIIKAGDWFDADERPSDDFKNNQPNAETRAALSESNDVEKLEQVSIKKLLGDEDG